MPYCREITFCSNNIHCIYLIVSALGVDEYEQRAGARGSRGLPVAIRVDAVDGNRWQHRDTALTQGADLGVLITTSRMNLKEKQHIREQ